MSHTLHSIIRALMYSESLVPSIVVPVCGYVNARYGEPRTRLCDLCERVSWRMGSTFAVVRHAGRVLSATLYEFPPTHNA